MRPHPCRIRSTSSTTSIAILPVGIANSFPGRARFLGSLPPHSRPCSSRHGRCSSSIGICRFNIVLAGEGGRQAGSHSAGHGPANASRADHPPIGTDRTCCADQPTHGSSCDRPRLSSNPQCVVGGIRAPTVDGTGLNRVPYRLALVQSGSKPQHLDGSIRHTTPLGGARGVFAK